MTPFNLYHSDCLEVLSFMGEASIDALVTDPPAGIAFMGKAWDKDRGGRDHWIAWMTGIMRECLRVLKPGAHGLVWALPRTSHWTATALEDAGFEIRDVVTHIQGQGFPKSLDIGQGFGTALKPACENWILVRRPLGEKTVAANVLKHGAGGLNIDGCRIGTEQIESGRNGRTECESQAFGKKLLGTDKSFVTGRFPANLVLSHNPDCDDACTGGCAVAELDRQSGHTKSPEKPVKQGGHHRHDVGLSGKTRKGFGVGFGDSGGASRFFYVAKASKSDRGEGNTHPTVKSTKLMQYLVRLITPPGGTVLDPFAGSGSTGVAALREGFKFVGIEQDGESFETMQRRVAL